MATKQHQMQASQSVRNAALLTADTGDDDECAAAAATASLRDDDDDDIFTRYVLNDE